MRDVEIVLVGLLLAVAVLGAAARAIGVPYPIVLVIGGLGLGFVPGLPHPALPPDLVLLIFLPPLLYSAAFFADLHALRTDLRAISMAAIGLVLATALVVGALAHAIVPGLPWAAAFALGAVVAPTDPVAATTIARRLGAPRRIINVLEGESLLNDGTALVLYRVAVGAAVGGSFSFGHAAWEFFAGATGGVVIGVAVGWVIAEVRRRLDDVPVEVTISLLSGYAAYLPAERLGASGVLAAVTAGTYVGWRGPDISTARMRLQGFAIWEILIFLLNALLFVLIGLQLPLILDGLAGRPTSELLGQAAAVSAAVILTRLAWTFTMPYVVRALDRRPAQRERRVGWRPRMISGWSGMRGAVSLAAALALPADFPQRDVVLLLTYAVIFTTLVLQGLTLPWLIRRLDVHDDGAEEREELLARRRATEAALERLGDLSSLEWTRDDTVERMRQLYGYRQRRFAARGVDGDGGEEEFETRAYRYQKMVREVIAAQLAAVVELRNRGEISNDVMHRIERELDLERERLEI
jgi:CPA1 family monovalent cation:H+ antiporter